MQVASFCWTQLTRFWLLVWVLGGGRGRDRGVAFLLAEVGGLLLSDKWLVCCLDRDWHTEDVVIEVCDMELDRSAYPSALREGGEAM